MVFGVRDPAILKQVKAGDNVWFMPDRVNGQYVVTKIEKAGCCGASYFLAQN